MPILAYGCLFLSLVICGDLKGSVMVQAKATLLMGVSSEYLSFLTALPPYRAWQEVLEVTQETCYRLDSSRTEGLANALIRAELQAWYRWVSASPGCWWACVSVSWVFAVLPAGMKCSLRNTETGSISLGWSWMHSGLFSFGGCHVDMWESDRPGLDFGFQIYYLVG